MKMRILNCVALCFFCAAHIRKITKSKMWLNVLWQYVCVTKCPVMKCHVTKCLCDKMSRWQNALWQSDEMSMCYVMKALVTKCPVTKCLCNEIVRSPVLKYSIFSVLHFFRVIFWIMPSFVFEQVISEMNKMNISWPFLGP